MPHDLCGIEIILQSEILTILFYLIFGNLIALLIISFKDVMHGLIEHVSLY